MKPTHKVNLSPEQTRGVFGMTGAVIEPPGKGVAYHVELDFDGDEDLLGHAVSLEDAALDMYDEYYRVKLLDVDGTPAVTPEQLHEARRLARKYFDDARAWVVGSRVTGEHDDNSDLDVVVEAMPAVNDPDERDHGRFIRGGTGVAFHVFGDEDGPTNPDKAIRVR